VQNLLGLATQQGTNQAQQAQNLYNTQLQAALGASQNNQQSSGGLSNLLSTLTPFAQQGLTSLFSGGGTSNLGTNLAAFGGGARSFSAPSNVYSLSF
jgi:hypothetical protein